MKFKGYVILLLCAVAFYAMAGIGMNVAVGKPICDMWLGNTICAICVAFVLLVAYANGRITDKKETIQKNSKERVFKMYDLKNNQ